MNFNRYPAFLLSIILFFGATRLSANSANGLPCARSYTVYLPWLQTMEKAGDLQTLHRVSAIPDSSASVGSPLALTPDGQTVWVVNPDAGSISAMVTATQQKSAEISLGGEPWSLAIAPDGSAIYVVDRLLGRLLVVDPVTQQVRRALVIGSAPGMVALIPSGAYAFVTLTASGEVIAIDTANFQIAARWTVGGDPYALAISDDGDGEDWDEEIVITQLSAAQRAGGIEATDDGRRGRVLLLHPCAQTPLQEITLLPDEHGFPSVLAGVTIFEQRAWIALQRASPALPNSLTQTLFAAISTLDLIHATEELSATLPLNDQEIFGSPLNNPLAIAPALDGKRLYVVAGGSDLVEVIDIAQPDQPKLVKFLPVGINPRGIVISRDGKLGYVMNFLGRSVTILDLENLQTVREVMVTDETLTPDVLRGKILFNNASNPKLSRGGWISCASCHPDGGTDGVTWIFPDGPRQTPPLWNATQTLPWHWSAALDEAQDVESTIEGIQQGLGLAAGVEPALLGKVNAGRSLDLDALATYLATGIRAPRLQTSIVLTEEVAQGRAIFINKGCPDCHGGPTWTSSQMPGLAGTLDPDQNGMVDTVLRSVGTVNERDLRGNSGFDPPSLLGVRLTAPYFHDGSMATLEGLLRSGHPTPQAESTQLDIEEIRQIITFLHSIDSSSEPIR